MPEEAIAAEKTRMVARVARHSNAVDARSDCMDPGGHTIPFIYKRHLGVSGTCSSQGSNESVSLTSSYLSRSQKADHRSRIGIVLGEVLVHGAEASPLRIQRRRSRIVNNLDP